MSHGVPWQWAGQVVQVAPAPSTVTLWAGTQPLVVHPRATHPGQRLIAPGQWTGLPHTTPRPLTPALAVQRPTLTVEARPLAVYDALVGGAP